MIWQIYNIENKTDLGPIKYNKSKKYKKSAYLVKNTIEVKTFETGE